MIFIVSDTAYVYPNNLKQTESAYCRLESIGTTCTTGTIGTTGTTRTIGTTAGTIGTMGTTGTTGTVGTIVATGTTDDFIPDGYLRVSIFVTVI